MQIQSVHQKDLFDVGSRYLSCYVDRSFPFLVPYWKNRGASGDTDLAMIF